MGLFGNPYGFLYGFPANGYSCKALLLLHIDRNKFIKQIKTTVSHWKRWLKIGAVEQIRTVDLFLTKEVLCLLSYNSELATRMGLEPTTSSVTG